MADRQSGNGAGFIFALLILAATGAVVYLVWRSNQVVRPFPGKPAPVVPQLPDLAAELSKIKSLCESRALAAKGSLRRLEARKQLPIGEKLYGEVKAESDATITFLITGMAVRFKDTDDENVRARMRALGKKSTAFLDWADGLTNKKGYGAEDPISAILALLGDWLKGVREENEKAIKQISASLEGCRFRNWTELGPIGESVP